ncbi:MAG: hypothetical protein DMF91_20790 [Acidobacteria bacterium]|nr:MAG: hypothetical protein DMF91_20790 [Acidobacteriota bacterium]
MFAPDGLLARVLPEFELRAGQAEMADAVARAFAGGSVLLAEAGTGTGKTLAYLIPAILSRQRVLISTGTKNLQEQIFFKDIPALREALGIPFTATYMKGRANYLCLHKLDQLNDGVGPAVHDIFLPIIKAWAGRSARGSRVLERSLRDGRDMSRRRLPALRRVLRHADASARGLVGPRHRQSSSAVRRRGGASERVRRGHPRLQPRRARRSASARRRRHPVLRLQREHLPARGARARHRAIAAHHRGG